MHGWWLRKPHNLPALKLVIYNHKGGVGKTTLTFNLAAALGALGRRVLLVDSDPQCNLTAQLITEDVVDDLLDNSDGPKGRTIWSGVKPIAEGTGDIKTIKPIELSSEGLHIIPGDIRLSEFESELNEFWSQSFQRKIRGLRGTSAISNLATEAADAIGADYIFFDAGPNIGALNRVILLDSDFFIVPVAYDLFSLRALKTLGRTLVTWIRDWSTIAELAPEGSPLLKGRPAFLGYIPEGFKVYGGVPSSQHARFMPQIEREVQSQIIAVLKDLDPTLVRGTLRSFKLGEVKNFGSLVAASQNEGVPIYELGQAGSPQQRDEARAVFAGLAKRVDDRVHDHSS